MLQVRWNKEIVNDLGKGRTPLRNSEWHWPIESGEKRKKKK